MIITAGVVIIAVIATVAVLGYRAAARPDRRAPAVPDAPTAVTSADLSEELQRTGLQCLRASTDPEIDICESPLLYSNGGSYARLRWFSLDGMQEFEYFAEGVADEGLGRHRERIRLLTTAGLSAADTDEIIDAFPAAEANGHTEVETAWGDVRVVFVDPPGRFEIFGRKAGAADFDHPGKSFQGSESDLNRILRRHRFSCDQTRGDGLECAGTGSGSLSLHRLGGTERFNHLGIGTSDPEQALLADLLPELLGPDAAAVQEIVDEHGSDEYYRSVAAGYLVGVGYESLTIESVRW